MMWSKIKKNTEMNFSDNLKGRIQLYTTTYSKDQDTGDLANRGWITLDGKEVVNFSTMESFRVNTYVYNSTTPTNCVTSENKYTVRSENKLAEIGEFSKFDLSNCCYAYLNMSIDEAINHQSPIINLLAVLDRRFGKRRLKELNIEKLHPLVNFFLNVRLEAENMNGPTSKNNEFDTIQ